MGSFYANVTVVGPSADDVFDAAVEVERPAAVGIVDDNTVVVYVAIDSVDDWFEALAPLGGRVLAAAVFDDDLLQLAAAAGGALVTMGTAGPTVLEVLDQEAPAADGESLAQAFGAAVDPVVALVATADEGGDEFVFASERHAALCQALGLPTAAAGFGLEHLVQGDDDIEGLRSLERIG